MAVPEEKVIGDITTAPGSVGLTFKHILSKVEFRFTYTNGKEDQKLVVKEFGFDAAKSGNCETYFTGNENLIGAVWTEDQFSVDGNNDYVYFPGDSEWSSGNISSTNYVIPQSNENLFIPAITIQTIKTSTGEVMDIKTYTNVPLKISGHLEWLPGYVYRYKADITPGEHFIHFTTSVKTWIDEDDRNQTIQNGN